MRHMENQSNIVRTQPSEIEGCSGLTSEIASQLIEAVFKTPKLSVACAYVGIHYRTVKSWILEGALPDASEDLRQFSLNMYQAEASVVAELQALLMASLRDGIGQPKVMMDLIKVRIPLVEDEDSVASILANHVDQAKYRKQMLVNPPPVMIAELNAAGWYKK